MTEYMFHPEMMQERERQLIMALSDCAGAYYDINFTKNIILGNAIQIVDGVQYSINEKIGMPKNCPYTDMINYWGSMMDPEEQPGFYHFYDIVHIKKRYENGERLISHKYWTRNVCGNPMLAIQKIRLYEDCITGDLMGIAYVTDDKERDELQERDAILTEQYYKAANEIMLMETLSENVPGGYHRCSLQGGFNFILEFVSQSFLDVVGWTGQEIEDELNREYINLVYQEDRDYFNSYESILAKEGRVNMTYRIRRKDGTIRWVQDATVRLEKDGEVFYQCALADITDYVEKLNKEKERAETSNLAKSTFLFNASHDIRTPINAIQGFARIIKENANNPQVVQEAVEKILQSGDTLNILINDILEVSRIERGKDEVEEQPLDMKAYIDKLYQMFAFEMQQAGINFFVKNDMEHVHVLGDDLKLTRIAMNLLSNAKKFTAAGGDVTFGIIESNYNGEQADYTLYVRDTGIGMSDEFQKRAFDQFERERTSTESGIIGSGLGLAIIKRLCDLMNGEYNIKSELGKGTEITVKVSLKQFGESLDINDIDVDYTKFAGKKILLVEDNEFNREIARYTLEGVNMIIDEAENGFVAVDKLLKAGPGYYDLVLMDIQMPVMDGYTATKEIRNIENKQIASVPIIAMTANAFDEDKQKCLNVGMNGHLGKPLDVDKIMREIAGILRK